MKKVEKEEVKKQLEEAFALWKNTGKKGNDYLTGNDCNNHKLVGFYNKEKRNEKEPDIRIYELDSENKIGQSVCSLWNNESKDKKTKYLTGITSDNEKIVAFFNSNCTNNQPIIRAYFKDEN